MRRGLMLWREDELPRKGVIARQRRLQQAMRAEGLDAVVVYTNNVRSAAVTWLTGFTPYWADALLLVPVEGQSVFYTALSKRVGKWMSGTNPTCEILHSPTPGRLLGKRLDELGASSVGVVEIDRMPGGLVDEIEAEGSFGLADATALFASVRTLPDMAELSLVARADEIAAKALARLPDLRSRVGDVSEAAELAVRQAGAEECYVAVAADLARDHRLARRKGAVPLGERFALRLSVAYNGVWIRRTESFATAGEDAALSALSRAVDTVASRLDIQYQLAQQLSGEAWPEGISLAAWSIEAPVASRPLELVASDNGEEGALRIPYGVVTLRFDGKLGPSVFSRAFGYSPKPAREREAA